MAEGGYNERQGLFKSSKTQAKYGTTSKVISANESFIKHIVKNDETLQGIALKYSCTVSRAPRGRALQILSDHMIMINSCFG